MLRIGVLELRTAPEGRLCLSPPGRGRPTLVDLCYNETALKISRAPQRLKCRAPSVATLWATATTREVADDRLEPTHRSDHRCRRRRGNQRPTGVRPSAAGRSAAKLAGGRQGRLLRKGQCPHPLRRNRLRLPAIGDARRRPELAHQQLADRGDQRHGGVQERLPRDHHGPAQRHQRRIRPARFRSTIRGTPSPTTSSA